MYTKYQLPLYQTGTPEKVRADTDTRERQSCSRFAAASATSESRVVAMKRDRTNSIIIMQYMHFIQSYRRNSTLHYTQD